MLDFRVDTFLAVCRCMSFTRAADALHITQPAVSQHIRALEAQYGARFFSFEGKKLALTDAGLAASLVKKLAAADPERYGPAYEQLGKKAEKVLRRQQEQRRHEKNLRLGKRKPWVAPTKDGKALSGAEARLAAQKPGEKHPGRPKVPKKGPGDRDKA